MASLIETLFGERKTETYEIEGKKIVMQTLTREESGEVLKNTGFNGTLAQFESVKEPMLARAIISIDGNRWSDFDEIREELKKEENKNVRVEEIAEKYLRKFCGPIINILYDFYLDLAEKQRKEKESLKKTSITQFPDLSGKSADTSNEPQSN